MNAHRQPLASLLITAFASLAIHSHACAQAALSRADVIAQLHEAERTGDVLAAGDSGRKLNELTPARYPRPDDATGKSRAQVVAELQVAVRQGDVLAPGDSGLKMNERDTARYPAAPGAGLTRDQVKAETRAAIRTGDVLAPGDSSLKLNELTPRRYAETGWRTRVVQR